MVPFSSQISGPQLARQSCSVRLLVPGLLVDEVRRICEKLQLGLSREMHG